jgi:hypothetical protein
LLIEGQYCIDSYDAKESRSVLVSPNSAQTEEKDLLPTQYYIISLHPPGRAAPAQDFRLHRLTFSGDHSSYFPGQALPGGRRGEERREEREKHNKKKTI